MQAMYPFLLPWVLHSGVYASLTPLPGYIPHATARDRALLRRSAQTEVSGKHLLGSVLLVQCGQGLFGSFSSAFLLGFRRS